MTMKLAVCTLLPLIALCYAQTPADTDGEDLGMPEIDGNAAEQENPEEVVELSPDEWAKMMDIIKKIDTDSDKHLSEAEITVWIQKVYRQYALDNAKERFPDFDRDGDGTITWKEYNNFVNDSTVDADEGEIVGDAEEESVRFLQSKEKKRFEFADKDGIPGLNLMEFLAFTHPSEVDDMADYAIEDVLNEYDKDKNGLISLEEFIGNIRVKGGDEPSNWEADETIRFKELYDEDKDGQLNRKEQLRWVAPNSYSSAREEAVYLIMEVDQNGDRLLSEAEIMSNQHIFMNSEVTDYGRQLRVNHDEL